MLKGSSCEIWFRKSETTAVMITSRVEYSHLSLWNASHTTSVMVQRYSGPPTGCIVQLASWPSLPRFHAPVYFGSKMQVSHHAGCQDSFRIVIMPF